MPACYRAVNWSCDKTAAASKQNAPPALGRTGRKFPNLKDEGPHSMRPPGAARNPNQNSRAQFLQICAAANGCARPIATILAAVQRAGRLPELGAGRLRARSPALPGVLPADRGARRAEPAPQAQRADPQAGGELRRPGSQPRTPARSGGRDGYWACALTGSATREDRHPLSHDGRLHGLLPWLRAKRSIVPLFPGYLFIVIVTGWWARAGRSASAASWGPISASRHVCLIGHQRPACSRAKRIDTCSRRSRD